MHSRPLIGVVCVVGMVGTLCALGCGRRAQAPESTPPASPSPMSAQIPTAKAPTVPSAPSSPAPANAGPSAASPAKAVTPSLAPTAAPAAPKTDAAAMPAPPVQSPAATKAAPRAPAPAKALQPTAPAARTEAPNPSEGLVVIGTVLVASHVPQPSEVPYDTCVTFVKYRVEGVEQGAYAGKELLAVLWGMRDGQLQPAARFGPGQRHRLVLEPFADHKELARVMQADDTNEYSLTPYWVVRYEGR